jgi:hypothetical protein
MATISHPLALTQWTFPAMCNYRDSDRMASRKRSRDVDDESENGNIFHHENSLRGASKKARVHDAFDASSIMGAFDASLSRADDRIKDDGLVQDYVNESTAATEALEVAKVIAILLDTLDKKTSEYIPSRPNPYKRLPTSPLSDSPHRAPFVRKVVGGVCAGRVDQGLQKWLLRKNHIDKWVCFFVSCIPILSYAVSGHLHRHACPLNGLNLFMRWAGKICTLRGYLTRMIPSSSKAKTKTRTH